MSEQKSKVNSLVPAERAGGVGPLDPVPFFRSRRTWLVTAGILSMLLVVIFGRDRLGGEAMEGLDPVQVALGLGIFCCIAFLWLTEALPLAVTALFVPLLATVAGVMDLQGALVAFADPLIFLFFGGFALASALSYRGIDRWIASYLLRVGRGRFIRVCCMLFGLAGFLSMWMSNTATTAVMIPLALGILSRVSEAPGFRGNKLFLLLGLAYAASIGGLGTIIGSPPNGIAAARLGLTFAEWMRFGVPVVCVLLPVMVMVLYFVVRPSRGLCIAPGGEEVRFDRRMVPALVIFVVVGICWVSGGWLGAWIGVTGSFDTLVALAAVLALVVLRVVPWDRIKAGTDWGVLLLFGGGIALSNVFRDTGASAFLARLLAGGIEGWGVLFVLVAVIAFVIFLTELSSNTATAALLVPVFYAVSQELGMPAAALVVPLALAASCAFMLPVATPPNALVFATGHIRQSEMMRTGMVLNLVFVLVLALISLVWL